MESYLSNPYKYYPFGSDSYLFETDHGAKYRVYFTEWPEFFGDYPELQPHLKHFGFSIQQLECPTVTSDPRIGATVVRILLDFFTKNPLGILIYVVASDDGKHRARKRKFDAWFRTVSGPIEKLDGWTGHGESQDYFSLVLRKDHPDSALVHDFMGYFRLLENAKPQAP